MAAEQRIIGGGLLFVGIAVVLILVFTFWSSGIKPDEAYSQIKDGPWPAFLEAERDSEYLVMKRKAGEIVDLLDEAGRKTVLKIVAGDVATSSDAGLRRLKEMTDRADLKKIAGGQYPLGSAWFDAGTHRELSDLEAAVEDLRQISTARRIARKARDAVLLAGVGSSGKVDLGSVAVPPRDAENPLYAHDAELFRVLGTNTDNLAAALGTPSRPAGKARTARLRWNNTVAPSTLAQDLEDLPKWIARLKAHGETVRHAALALADVPEAKDFVQSQLGKAYRLLGAGLDETHAKAYAEAKDRFADAAMIAAALDTEAGMLEPYRVPLVRLAPLFRRRFDP